MEHDDRAPVATFVADAELAPGTTVRLNEAAAHHARVKRLETGDPVRVTDGAGRLGMGTLIAIERGTLEIYLAEITTIPALPAIHLRVPIGDRDRMLWLAEKATELGIASWQAVRFKRSMSVSPRGEGAAFAEKVRARMTSALEQSGGAWRPHVLPDTSVDELSFDVETTPILLDVAGEPLASLTSLATPDARSPVVLFGPEGGAEPSESRALATAGWRRASLAPTTLRFETAGIAAVAILRAASMRA